MAVSLETWQSRLDAIENAIASGTLTFGEIVGEGGEVVSRLGASI